MRVDIWTSKEYLQNRNSLGWKLDPRDSGDLAWKSLEMSEAARRNHTLRISMWNNQMLGFDIFDQRICL